MPSLLKRSLESKFILALGLALTSLLALSSVVDIWLERRDVYRIEFMELEVLANTIQKSLIKDMREGKSVDVQEILEMVGTEKGIVSVKIFDEKGRILKSSKRDEMGSIVPAYELETYRSGQRDYVSTRSGEKVFHVIQPIANAPPCYGCHDRQKEINGILSLQYSPKPLQNYMRYHTVKMLALLAVTILVSSLFIYLLMSRLVANPIKRMKAAMSEAENGNFDISIPVTSEDEIGSLQRSFNNMLAKIKGLTERNIVQQRDLVRKEQELQMQQALARQNEALESAHSEAVEKNRYYMEMLSFISHELKNPLVVLKGYTTLLLKGDLGDLRRTQREALIAMEKNVEVLKEMIMNYMDLSRIERGELKPEKRLTDLIEDVIRPVMDSHAELLEKAGMSIRIDFNGSLKKINLDPGLMKSAIGNIFSNAIKYGWHGTDIIVDVTAGKDFFSLSVFNEGGGIPYGDLEKVFERFTRLENEETRSQKGSGLGLCIVREIIELHGGKVWAESKEGAWAKITLDLPLETAGGDGT